MPTNEVFRYAETLGAIAPTNPLVVVAAGNPVRLGNMTGVALTLEGQGGNAAGQCTVDFGLRVWDLLVTDAVGGGIAAGDVLFYQDGAPGTITNGAAGFFFGFALEPVGMGLTATIRVLHVPSPAAGALGAGTVGDVNLAVGAVSVTKLANAILTGLKVATVADANTAGGIPVVHRIAIAGGAAGNTDVVLDHKTRVLDAWAVHTAAGEVGDTIQVLNGAAAITDAMDWGGADKAIVRAGEIDDAAHEIAAGGTLRVTTTDSDAGGDVGAGEVYVLGIRVA